MDLFISSIELLYEIFHYSCVFVVNVLWQQTETPRNREMLKIFWSTYIYPHTFNLVDSFIEVYAYARSWIIYVFVIVKFICVSCFFLDLKHPLLLHTLHKIKSSLCIPRCVRIRFGWNTESRKTCVNCERDAKCKMHL